MNNQIKEDMKSILDNRPELVKEVNKVAEVAGYLWQKGWAERNGGNITVNITEYVDDEIRQMPAISEVKQIGVTLPHLKGCYFYCKGTNMRMRDLARWPMDNGSVIRILDDCASYVIIADKPVQPTSEVPSHLSVHNYLISIGSPYKASVHTPHRTDCLVSQQKVHGERCGNQPAMEHDSRNKSILPTWIGHDSLSVAQFCRISRCNYQGIG